MIQRKQVFIQHTQVLIIPEQYRCCNSSTTLTASLCALLDETRATSFTRCLVSHCHSSASLPQQCHASQPRQYSLTNSLLVSEFIGLLPPPLISQRIKHSLPSSTQSRHSTTLPGNETEQSCCSGEVVVRVWLSLAPRGS